MTDRTDRGEPVRERHADDDGPRITAEELADLRTFLEQAKQGNRIIELNDPCDHSFPLHPEDGERRCIKCGCPLEERHNGI